MLFTFIPAQATFCILCNSIVLKGSHSLPDQLPGEHTGPPSHTRQYLFLSFGLSVQHSLTHSLIADRSTVAGHVPTDHTFFYLYQSHRHDSTQPSLFMSWVALCEPLVCSYDISHSRAQ